MRFLEAKRQQATLEEQELERSPAAGAKQDAALGSAPKAASRARALAKELGVSLERCKATGKGGTITVTDVRRAAEQGGK